MSEITEQDRMLFYLSHREGHPFLSATTKIMNQHITSFNNDSVGYYYLTDDIMSGNRSWTVIKGMHKYNLNHATILAENIKTKEESVDIIINHWIENRI